jgi:hypothetical protein
MIAVMIATLFVSALMIKAEKKNVKEEIVILFKSMLYLVLQLH